MWRGVILPSKAARTVLSPPAWADPNVTFARPPAEPLRVPEISPIELPAFPGACAIWGARGRDDRGHMRFGVSAAGEERSSAHLLEFDPDSRALVDRGDVLN